MVGVENSNQLVSQTKFEIDFPCNILILQGKNRVNPLQSVKSVSILSYAVNVLAICSAILSESNFNILNKSSVFPEGA